MQRLFNDESHVSHYSLEDSSISLSDNAKTNIEKIADEYFEQNKKDLVVTSGTRTAEEQAEAMYEKLAGGDNLKVYNDQKSAGEIKEAYDKAIKAGDGKDIVIADMTKVIQTQISKGVYISAHLSGNAV